MHRPQQRRLRGGVHLFDAASGFEPVVFLTLFRPARFVPDDLLIERQHDPLGRVFARRHTVGHRHDLFDIQIHSVDIAKKPGSRVVRIPEILVQQNEVDIVETVLDYRIFPSPESLDVMR